MGVRERVKEAALRFGRTLFPVWFLVLLLPAEAAGVRQRAHLDASFGRRGEVLLPYGNAHAGARDVAVDSQGRAVLVGLDEIDGDAAFAVTRVLESGTLDRSFGDGGVARTSFRTDYPDDAGGQSDFPYGVAIQRDGKILAAGRTQDPGAMTTGVALVRHMPSGAIDRSFGDGGRVITEPFCVGNACGPNFAEDLAIQPDGRILVVGEGYLEGEAFAVMRYLPNGRIDESFGTGGIAVTSLGTLRAKPHAIALHRGGIVIVGWAGDYFGVVRYHADGRLDHSFGIEGRQLLEIGPDDAFGVAVDRQDRIVLAGRTVIGTCGLEIYDWAVVRLRPNGDLDQTFSGDGVTTLKMADDESCAVDQAHDVVVQRDGRAVVVGMGLHPGADFGVVRFTERGRRDRTFGRKGKLFVDFDRRGDWGLAVALDDQGRIVVAGESTVSGPETQYRFAVARIDD
jgi:uncharacterized delta-60 repeat protein